MTFIDYCKELPTAIFPKKELAEKLMEATGCTEPTAYRWIRGESLPRKNQRVTISKILGIPAETLWPGIPT